MGLLHPGSIAFLPSSSDRPQSKPRLSRMTDPPELPRFNSARGAVPHSRAHESMQEPKGFLNLRGSQCSVLTLLGPFCAMPSGSGAFPEPRDFFDRGPEFLFALPFQAQPRFSAFCIYPPLRTPVSRVTRHGLGHYCTAAPRLPSALMYGYACTFTTIHTHSSEPAVFYYAVTSGSCHGSFSSNGSDPECHRLLLCPVGT